MPFTKSVRSIIGLWLAWAVILIGFQALVNARYQPLRPDYALMWTPTETGVNSMNGRIYLTYPFMNNQIAWDSEYYLSISIVGYDDPAAPSLQGVPPAYCRYQGIPLEDGRCLPNLSLNYAFYPFYPLVMRVVSFPLRLLPLAPIARATLAGVIVSLLGTLGGMLALYDVARDDLGDSGGLRAAFYLIIFPSGFFLAQVYTEGLFIGLAFGSLALLRHKCWWWAGLLAGLATLTRSVGIALILPMAIVWWRDLDWDSLSFTAPPWKRLLLAIPVLLPLVAYGIWSRFLGTPFHLVEDVFFGRQFLAISRSLRVWTGAFRSLFGRNPQQAAYYAVEFGCMLLALVVSTFTARRYPGLTVFGLAVFVISVTSGVPQGMHRYVLAMPGLFVGLSRWGRNEVFDRAWTIASLLLMGMIASLFTFNMWAG